MSDLMLFWPMFEPSDPWSPTGETFYREGRQAIRTYNALWKAIDTLALKAAVAAPDRPGD